MGTRLEAAAAVRARRGPFRKSARKLADQAARACLARARLEADDVDLLINAGLYREDNLAEPALAALIQEDIGANPGHPPRKGAHGTFSFDVANGGCGVLTALELIDGFVRSGTIRTGLVVASDCDPGTAEPFPFPAVGGAMLVRAASSGGSFVDFAFETFDEAGGVVESAIRWREQGRRLPLSAPGKNVLAIAQSDGYESRAIECAEEATRRFLARHELDPRCVDLAVLSQSPEGFADGLAMRLGFAPRRVARVADNLRGAHTAGPIAALDAAIASGEFAAARTIVFVTAGAGIVVGLALYRN